MSDASSTPRAAAPAVSDGREDLSEACSVAEPGSAMASCTSNAFAEMFRMARNASRGRSSPAPSESACSTRSAPAAPQLAHIERDRKIAQKRPAERRNAVAGQHKRTPTNVSLEQRLKEYPNQSFTISGDQLRCVACKKPLQNIKSTLDAHVTGSVHRAAVKQLQERISSEADVHRELISYYTENPGEKGSSVAPDATAYRFAVVQTLLAAGIPLSKLDLLRPVLERSGFALTAATHMMQLVPKVEAAEFGRVVAELDGQRLSLSFDGTTRLGEAVNIVARWCSSSFTIKQRLVRFVTLQQHADGARLAGLITALVLQQLHLPFDAVVAFSRDSAAVNGAAIGMLGMFSSAANVMCVSHTLNNVGARFSFPALSAFSTAWITLMHSHAARQQWGESIGHSPRRYSSVRSGGTHWLRFNLNSPRILLA